MNTDTVSRLLKYACSFKASIDSSKAVIADPEKFVNFHSVGYGHHFDVVSSLLSKSELELLNKRILEAGYAVMIYGECNRLSFTKTRYYDKWLVDRQRFIVCGSSVE